MKRMDIVKRIVLNLEELENVSGGTGPLNYPYASCDPAMKETGPLNYPYASCDPAMKETGPLNYPYASCDPAMKKTGPLNYPYMSNKTGRFGVRV